MKSRSSHAMVFNSVDRHLYIIGGQRGEYLNDFFAINVDTLTVNFLNDRVSCLYVFSKSQVSTNSCVDMKEV